MPPGGEQAVVVATLAPGTGEVGIERRAEPVDARDGVERQQVPDPDRVEHRRVSPRAIGSEPSERGRRRCLSLLEGGLVAGREVQQRRARPPPPPGCRSTACRSRDRVGRRGRRTGRRARGACGRARRACGGRSGASRRRPRPDAAGGRAGRRGPPSTCAGHGAVRPIACRHRDPVLRARTRRPSSLDGATGPRPSAGAAARSTGRARRCRRSSGGGRRARARNRRRPRRGAARSRDGRRRRGHPSAPRGRSRQRAPGSPARRGRSSVGPAARAR